MHRPNVFNDSVLGVFLLFALATSIGAQDAPNTQRESLPSDAPPGMALVDAASLKKHAFHLASDELGGRYTGMPGQVEAAKYIADHFASLGLVPLGDGKGKKRSFFQKYPLDRTYLDAKGTSITFGGETYTTGFAVVARDGARRVRATGQFVYCGTGNPRNAPKSLKRKIPVVLLASSVGGPRPGMRGNRATLRAGQIAKEMERRGAQVVVFLVASANSNVMDGMNRSALLPEKHILRYRDGARRGRPGRSSSGKTIPALYLPPDKARALLGVLGMEADQDGPPRRVREKVKASGKVHIHVKHDTKFKAMNVCAMLKGSGKSQEAIVYSAHMDHMGTRMDGDAFNGADDNASGTSALLVLAKAFAKGGQPKRNVIFLAVSGEELGLWGSHFYSEHPTWPIKRIIANINIDMIGRQTRLSPTNVVSATPSPAHAKFSTLVRDAARIGEKLGMRLTSGDTYYQRSDHYNFAKKDVPIVFFCDGEHEDYHRVTDHPDKLDYTKMERIARLAYWTGFRAADAKIRPRVLGRSPSWTK